MGLRKGWRCREFDQDELHFMTEFLPGESKKLTRFSDCEIKSMGLIFKTEMLTNPST